MRVTRQLKASLCLLKVRLGGRPVPVAVRWNLLDRCINRCAYCNIWGNSATSELPTEIIKRGLAELKSLGTVHVSFSGGEPLLRKDIGELVSCAAELGLAPSMNSSGYMLHKRIDQLAGLELLKISLDGPEEIHDLVRGRKGAFAAAIEAAELASRRLKKISFSTTITRFNVHHLPQILEIAEGFGCVVAFQPVKDLYRGVENVGELAPDAIDMRDAVAWLTDQKRGGNRSIRNSLAELKYISDWPNYPPLECSAGKVFIMIDSDGTILPCDRVSYATPLPNIRTSSIGEAIGKLPAVSCSGCGFCGSLELNMLYSLDPRPLADVVRLVN